MAAKKVSYTQLTHDVVFAAKEPLPFAEIMARVNQITPITTKKNQVPRQNRHLLPAICLGRPSRNTILKTRPIYPVNMTRITAVAIPVCPAKHLERA